MTFKPEQAQAFYSALTGAANPPMAWQTFCDYEKIKDDPRATWWNGYLDVDRLVDRQAMGCGVFATVNGGGRYARDISQFRAVFMDSDGIPLPTQWVVPPHAIVMRDATHYHAYWFLDGDCQAPEWSIAQKQIALHYGSDDSINNPDRVMRVPGFLHKKDLHNPQLYELVYLNTEIPRYKLRNIIANFTLSSEKSGELAAWINQRNGKFLNEAEDYDDCEANQVKYIEYLTQRAEHGIDGQGRNAIRFKTAAAGRDYGLSPEKTIDLMVEHWDHGNTPPCGEDLIQTSVTNAYRYNQNKLGSRSFGMFLQSEVTPLVGMSLTPVESTRYVPEQSVVPERQAIDIVAKLLTASAPGELIIPEGDGFFSKNHTANALAYLAQRAPNGEVILSDDDIYVFNGKIFEQKEAKFIQGELSHMMAHVAPSSSDIDGSASMVKNRLRNTAPQHWPQWRDDRERNTDGVIVFDNGILDILTNEWFEHTPLLRTRNSLPYAFDHTATCPEWEKFLHGVWGGTAYAPLIDTLQMWFGYLLTNDQSQQKMAFFIGKPRSGKGTIMRVIEDMLGKHNCASPSLANLTNSSMLHSMSTKMAAIFNDVSDTSASSRGEIVANLKKIVGEDSISFDRKYKEAMSAQFRCRVMLTCNAMPNLAESSTAIVDRGIFFYLDTTHAGREDIALGTRLKAEMPGIINWAIAGLHKLRTVGRLTNHESVLRRVHAFRVTSNPLELFTEAHLIYRSDACCSVMDVFKRYRGWSIETDGGSGIKSLTLFARQIEAMPDLMLDSMENGLMLRGAFLRPMDIEPDIGQIP